MSYEQLVELARTIAADDDLPQDIRDCAFELEALARMTWEDVTA